MSQSATTTSGAQATAAPTLFEIIEAKGHTWLTAVEHAAVRLVGDVATAETSLSKIEESSPMFRDAWVAGQASAAAYGVPVMQIEGVFNAVMAAAKQFAASLSSPPPTPAAAT